MQGCLLRAVIRTSTAIENKSLKKTLSKLARIGDRASQLDSTVVKSCVRLHPSVAIEGYLSLQSVRPTISHLIYTRMSQQAKLVGLVT